ncbi:MAG: hypothetical protein ACLQIK_05370 [Mycobacterium sp.]
MSALTVGTVAETAPGERRVALSPEGARPTRWFLAYEQGPAH